MHTASVPDDISTHAVLATRAPTSPDPPLAPAARAGSRLGESGTGGPLGPSPRKWCHVKSFCVFDLESGVFVPV